MSQIAKDTGIGRATLYKYFPDVESILIAWHDRQIDHHLQELIQARDQATGAAERLETILTAYAQAIYHRRAHDNDIAGMLHHGEHVAAAHQHLREFIQELVSNAAAARAIRQDVSAGELTIYCLHALAAATSLPDPAAIHRLVRTTVTGIRTSDPE